MLNIYRQEVTVECADGEEWYSATRTICFNETVTMGTYLTLLDTVKTDCFSEVNSEYFEAEGEELTEDMVYWDISQIYWVGTEGEEDADDAN